MNYSFRYNFIDFECYLSASEGADLYLTGNNRKKLK
jgi:hypothetical protein